MEKFMKWLERVLGKYPFSVISTNIFSILFALVISWLCFQISSEPLEQVFNILLAITGALVGWALGMFFQIK